MFGTMPSIHAGGGGVGPPVTDGIVGSFDPALITGVTFTGTAGDGEDIDEVINNAGGGSNWDAFSTSGTADPTWEDSAQNGLGMISLYPAGGNRALVQSTPPLSGTEEGELWLVVKPSTTGVDQPVWQVSVSGASYHPLSSNNLWNSAGSNSLHISIAQSPAGVVDSANLINVVGSSSEWSLYVNDVQQHTTATNTVQWLTTWYLGAHSSGISYQGLLGEFLVFDRILTAQERTDLRDYFNTKWGLGF